jgi:2'-5' RNA ligase
VPREDRPYAARWQQFRRLNHTQDSLASDRRGLRRWLLMPYITFIIPIEEPGVVAQLTQWQEALRPWLPYDPQPTDRFHISVHYVGGLREKPWLWLPQTWRRAALPALVERAHHALKGLSCFEIQIGPLNAFPNVLITEVQDEQECLRVLRARLRRSLPLRARPPSPWPYLPHVTLGYWGEQPTAPIVKAIAPFRKAAPMTLNITSVQLTIYSLGAVPLHPDVLLTAREEIVAEFALQE